MCFVHPFSEWRCGHCFECLQERRSDWTLRLLWDAEHVQNPFIFHLTYSDEHLPKSPSGKSSLCKRDIDLFFKRLRHEFPENKISYFLCGEYSPEKLRPHYHCAIFGIPSFLEEDKVKKILQKAWSLRGDNFGFVLSRSCWCRDTGQIHYITKYMLNAFDWDPNDDRQKPFNFMSKGIGKSFIDYAIQHDLFDKETQELFSCYKATHITPVIDDEKYLKKLRVTTKPFMPKNIEVFYYDEFGNIEVNPTVVNFRDFYEYSVMKDGRLHTYRKPLPRYWREKVLSEDTRFVLRCYKNHLAHTNKELYRKKYQDYDFDNDVPMWKQEKISKFKKFAQSKKDKMLRNKDKYIF